MIEMKGMMEKIVATRLETSWRKGELDCVFFSSTQWYQYAVKDKVETPQNENGVGVTAMLSRLEEDPAWDSPKIT